jgi:hypothetical protein
MIRNTGSDFDAHLAALYGVTTKALNQAVQAQSLAVPRGFHVSAHGPAMGSHQVTDRDHIPKDA